MWSPAGSAGRAAVRLGKSLALCRKMAVAVTGQLLTRFAALVDSGLYIDVDPLKGATPGYKAK